MRARGRRPAGWWAIPLLAFVSMAAGADLTLADATKARDRQAVRALIEQHADVNAPQADGATALHWAAHWDELELADLVIKAGARVNAANDYGVTPLVLACTNGSAAMVAKLLKAGANPNLALQSGETALMTAARSGSVETVNALLAAGADVNAKETARGQTALMWAAAEGHAGVIRALTEHGADIHARSAERRRLVATSQRLVKYAMVDEGMEWIEKGGYTPLLFAARNGHLEAAKALLAAGANANDTAPERTSALVVAAHSGHGAVGVLLLDKGADPNAADAGYTALQAAVLRGQLELVRALLAHGARPDAPLVKGTPTLRQHEIYVLGEHLVGATPMLLAAKFAEAAIMRVLADAGANVRATMKDGTTTVMLAAGLGWDWGRDASREGMDRRERAVYIPTTTEAEEEAPTFDAVKMALDLGADVNGVNQAGDTAVHAAASKGFNRVVQLLADRGAKLNVKNRRNQTPLGMAITSEALRSTAELLRQLGATE
jgi:ankyrin repeat protein